MEKEIEVLDRAEVSGAGVLVAYSKTEAALADLRTKHAGVVFDLTTTKGDKDARAARMELVKLRTSLEAKRKELKAPALELGSKIDSEAERVKGEILALETFIDQQIKADEKRRADEKAEKDRIEAVRVQGLRDKIAAIRACLQRCHGITAERIAKGIEQVGLVDVSADVFAELAGDALAAKSETLEAMKALHTTTAEREAVAARVEAQRLENERIAAEQHKQAEALAAQQAELDKAAAVLKDQQYKLAAEQAERDPVLAEKTSAEASAKVQPEQPAIDAAAPAKPDMVRFGNILIPREQIEKTWPAKPAPVTPPDLKLGQIAERLGFALTADFLKSLGFEPAGRDRSAVLYHSKDFPAICRALIEHIESVCEMQEA